MGRERTAMRLRILGLSLALLLAVGITVVSGVQAFSSFHALQASRHAHSNRPHLPGGAIRPWMTIRYVAHATRVPEPYLFSRVGIPPAGHSRTPIGQLARQYHRPAPQLIQQLQQAVQSYPGKEKIAVPTGSPNLRSRGGQRGHP